MKRHPYVVWLTPGWYRAQMSSPPVDVVAESPEAAVLSTLDKDKQPWVHEMWDHHGYHYGFWGYGDEVEGKFTVNHPDYWDYVDYGFAQGDMDESSKLLRRLVTRPEEGAFALIVGLGMEFNIFQSHLAEFLALFSPPPPEQILLLWEMGESYPDKESREKVRAFLRERLP